MADIDTVASSDPRVAELLGAEEQRQAATIDLIPFENYASPAVPAAIATATSAKYAARGIPASATTRAARW